MQGLLNQMCLESDGVKVWFSPFAMTAVLVFAECKKWQIYWVLFRNTVNYVISVHILPSIV